MTSTVNGASPILRRGRPTREQQEDRRKIVYEIVRESRPTGVRFVYYRAVALGLVPKTDAGYNSIQRTVLNMRRDGTIPWGWIADNTRWCYRPRTYESADDALAGLGETYNQTLWTHADSMVEVWCESESIAGVLRKVTMPWDVALFPCKGQPSDSFIYNAAQQHDQDDRPLTIYYVGDHDPAGLEIETNIVKKLGDYSDRDDVEVVRLGVTPRQVDMFDLIGTKPKKRTWKNAITGDVEVFHGDAYEVEALEAPYLRRLVELHIESHLDPRQVELARTIQDNNRDLFRSLAGRR